MATRKLEVEIIGDSRSLERAFARSQKASKEFQTGVTGQVAKVDSAFKRLGGIRTGAFVGGAALTGGIAIMSRATEAASNLQEQISKNRQVFGQSASAVESWSKTTASSMGIAQAQALEATGTFGNLFTAIGIVGPQAADFSRRLVTLAADLASFNNATPEDTLDAIRSGLVGEAEPLRRYGVLLSEARVQQVALATTGKTTAKSLTDQEKAAARVKIIFQDTTKAQGDFARTAGGLANQQRILTARWKDAQTELGQNLLPAMIKFTEVSNRVLGSLSNVRSETLLFSESFRNQLADAFGVEFVRDALAKAGPELEQAMRDFEATLDPFHIQVPIQLTPKVVGTGLADPSGFANLPGVDTGGPLGATLAGQINDIFASAKKQVAAAIAKGKAAVAKAAAEKAAQRRSDAFAKALGNLRLGVDKAELTPGLKDDIAALNVVADGLRKQIKAGVDVQAAQSELYSVLGRIEAKQQQIRETAQRTAEANARAARTREQARQFRALGLDPEGNRPPPAIANLKKQLAQLSSRKDLTGNQRGLLKRIREVLIDPIHKATPETRAAINDLFDTIRQGFDQGAKKLEGGPLTKTTALNANAALAGVTGLNRDQMKQIRANLSNFNSAGIALAGSQTGQPITVVVNSHTSVDGETVARNVTKHQQKATRRNPPQKRGPNRRGGV